MRTIRAATAPRFLGLLVCALLCTLPRTGQAATGTWLHFQVDGTGYTGFGTACAIDTRRGEAVMFGMWTYPVCFGTHGCSPYMNFDVTAFARFAPDPIVPTPTTLAGSPSGRENACAAYDSLGDQVWLFGGRYVVDSLCVEFGCSNRPALDDLWRLDRAALAWHPVAVTGARPAARYDAALVVDPIAQRLLLFGGHDSTGTAYGDLWSIPLAGPYVWTQLHPAGVGPTARWFATALIDPARQRLLLVGGSGPSGSAADIWSLNLVGPPAWTAVSVAGTAPTGVVHAILDVGRDLVLAYAGPTNIATFALSSSPTWTPLDAPNGPTTSSPGGFGYDPVHDVIWLPYAESTVPAGEAQHWTLTLAQPPVIPALAPVLDSVRYEHGFERQWWRLRPRHPGYSAVEAQLGDSLLGGWTGGYATQPAPDTSDGGVMTGLIGPHDESFAGVKYASRIAWNEGPFRMTGGETPVLAAPGPVDMAFSVDTATATRGGAVHVVWRAFDDSLSLLTPFYVERKDPGGWTPVLHDWPDSQQRIVLSELVPADTVALDYRIRWTGPRGLTYGGDVHLVRELIPALDPVLDSVRYVHGFEQQWWNLRPHNDGYGSVQVQMGDGLGAWGASFQTALPPDLPIGYVMTGLIPRSAGVAYASRTTWLEGPFQESGGETLLQAPPGPVDMAFSVDTATATRGGAVHVVWRAFDDSLSLLTPSFVERKDPGGWTPVLNDWPDAQQRIVLSESVPADSAALDYRIRWDGPRGPAYGGAVHVVRVADQPGPGSIFLSAPRPHPVTASAAVDFRLPEPGPATIRLFDLNGRQVREWTVAGPGASFTLDLHGLHAGLYIMRLQQGSHDASQRLVVFR